MTSPATVFNAFWMGFGATRPPPLDQTPDSVNAITLFTTGPADNSGYTTEALTKYYTAAQIKQWVKSAQQNGTRILMSIYDNPDHHWNQVDIPKFVKQAAEVIIGDWGLDGVDIDMESADASGEAFTSLIQEFRAALGPTRIIAADAYYLVDAVSTALQAARDDIDWVNLMAYFLWYDDMIERFNQFNQIMHGPQQLTIGVKPGIDRDDQSTPLDEVARLAAWQPDNGHKRGMMLYTLNRDTPEITNLPRWIYVKTIAEQLKQPTPG